MVASMQRALTPIRGTLENEMVILSGSWAIGAAGAVGAKTGGRGLSLTRTAAGSYTVQLRGLNEAAARVPSILNVHSEVYTSDTNPADDAGAIEARCLSKTASTGVVLLQTFDEAGAAQDPVSGTELGVTVILLLSSVNR